MDEIAKSKKDDFQVIVLLHAPGIFLSDKDPSHSSECSGFSRKLEQFEGYKITENDMSAQMYC